MTKEIKNGPDTITMTVRQDGSLCISETVLTDGGLEVIEEV